VKASSAEWFIPVFVLVLIVFASIWHSRRSRRVLERWAERNGYRIIDTDYRKFFRGPFFWTTSRGQTVYRVTVDVKGAVQRGWVRCGSRRLGLFSNQVEVRWDETLAVAVRRDGTSAQATDPMHDHWLDG
jgi:hypothetical protein